MASPEPDSRDEGATFEHRFAPESWELTLLLDAQSAEWQSGMTTPVESYLSSRHDLRDNPEAILNLVYHEVLLRRRLRNEQPTLAEYVARFPHLEDQLTIQFALDQALPEQGEGDPPADGPSGPLLFVDVPGYEILEVLGRGGMGIVYRAWQRSLNRPVALKMIISGPHSGEKQAARFRVEAEVIARLHHPNIVQIHEIGEHEGRPFLALEYVENGTLNRALRGTPMPVEKAVPLVETLARAVEHAHGRGVIHRDLKPANVLLAADGEPKITDFGLARLLSGDSRQTETGALLGTPSYMAPEQVNSSKAEIGVATDIYALGAILYETLTGRPPFQGESPIATMLQVREIDVVPPRRLRPELARDLETICLKCLEKDPRRRYETAVALADDLRAFREGRPIVARPVSIWERAWLLARRQKLIAASLGLGSLASAGLLLGGVYYSVQLGRLNTRLASSNRQLNAARMNAEASARVALAAITQMLSRVADQRLAGVPEAEPVRRDLLNDAIERLELLSANSPTDPEIRHEMAKAHHGIADVHRSLGEFAEAVARDQSALAILEPLLAAYPDDHRLEDSLAEIHFALAERFEPEEGKPHFLRAVALLEPRADRDRTIRGKLAAAYFSIAAGKKGFGIAPAESYLQNAITLLEGLARDEPLAYQGQLARALYNLGLAKANEGRNEQALEDFRRSLKLLAAVPPEGRSDSDIEAIATVQNALGFSLQVVGTPEAKTEAEDAMKQAIPSFETLVSRHPRRLVYRSGLSRAWSNLGSFYWMELRYNEAEAAYQEALRADEKMVHDFPEDRGSRILLAHGYQDLADARAKLDRLKEAREGFEKALEVIEPEAKLHPDDYRTVECLGTICLNYGNLARASEGLEASLRLRERAVEAFERAYRLEPTHAQAKAVLIGSLGNLSATYLALNRIDEALRRIDARIELDSPEGRIGDLVQKGIILAKAGRHEQAHVLVDSLGREPGLDGPTLYNLACVQSLAASAAMADAALDPAQKTTKVEGYRGEAIKLIERSLADEEFRRKDLPGLLDSDSDLDAVRTTDEFKALARRINDPAKVP